MLAFVATALLAVPGHASPDADTVLRNVGAALEPARPSTRTWNIEISAGRGESTRWVAGQARKTVDGTRRIVTVILAPTGPRGIAWLTQEADGGVEQSVYLPSIRRVRTLRGLNAYEPFLGSDFSYADLGFLDAQAKYRLRDTEKQDGVETYRLESIPPNQWYYSRILTWVPSDTWIPKRREFYDQAGQLWKVETIENVIRVDGTPTALRLRMEDRLSHSYTLIEVSDVSYDVGLPDALFERRNLPDAVSSPVWARAAR